MLFTLLFFLDLASARVVVNFLNITEKCQALQIHVEHDTFDDPENKTRIIVGERRTVYWHWWDQEDQHTTNWRLMIPVKFPHEVEIVTDEPMLYSHLDIKINLEKDGELLANGRPLYHYKPEADPDSFRMYKSIRWDVPTFHGSDLSFCLGKHFNGVSDFEPHNEIRMERYVPHFSKEQLRARRLKDNEQHHHRRRLADAGTNLSEPTVATRYVLYVDGGILSIAVLLLAYRLLGFTDSYEEYSKEEERQKLTLPKKKPSSKVVVPNPAEEYDEKEDNGQKWYDPFGILGHYQVQKQEIVNRRVGVNYKQNGLKMNFLRRS